MRTRARAGIMYATMFRDLAVILFLVLEYTDAVQGKICKVPNADAGTCTVIDKCDPMYELHIKRPRSNAEDAFYRQSVASCGSRGPMLKVCCPHTSQWEKLAVRPVMYPETPLAVSNTNEIPGHSDIDNRLRDPVPLVLTAVNATDNSMDKLEAWYMKFQQQLPACGVDTSSAQRIVGGKATEIDEYPWLALLEYQPYKYSCGGSLISRSHVLTAAHCLINEPRKVRLSEYNITSEPTDVVETNGGGLDYITVKVVDVAWTVRHPGYVPKKIPNDIGLIKMKEEVQYSDFIKPICLPSVDYRNTAFTVTTKFTVAGWGSDNEFTNSEVKRSVFVPYVPMDTCMEIYSPLVEGQQICAGGEEGKDSCRGDSGGPLMYEEDGSKFVLVGVVSHGPQKCGAKDRPGIYTYVYNYVDWIQKTMT